MKIRLSRAALATLSGHAIQSPTQECCGALLGTDGDSVLVAQALPLQNSAAVPEREYQIDARAYLAAERQAEQLGLDLVGFYHSHPHDSALASATDIAKAVPGFVYVIIASSDLSDVTAWLGKWGPTLEKATLVIAAD